MHWILLLISAAALSGVVGFSFATGVVAIGAKLALLVFGGLAIVLLLAKPSVSIDE